MIRKHFTMADEEAEIIEKIKNEIQVKSESEALRYILRQYAANERKEAGIQNAILRSIEEKVSLLLDVANTDLIKRGDEIPYPVNMVESPVIQKAREYRRKELANRKQRKDYVDKKSGGR